MKVSATKSLIASSILSLVATMGNSHAVTLIDPTILNGSFETAVPPITPDSQFSGGFDGNLAGEYNISNWANTNTDFTGAAAAYTDTGVRNQTSEAQEGNSFVFIKPGDGGAFNLTTYAVLAAGDQFTLTWYARSFDGTQGVRIFSSTDGTYATATTLATSTEATAFDDTYTQFTLGYTAVAGDVGKTIGVSFFNASSVGFTLFDNFNLNVVSAVPEPATYLYGLVGLAFCLYRVRRRRIAA